MNVYQWNFLMEPTTPPVVGDAAGLKKMCQGIGYLLSTGKGTFAMDVRLRPTVTTGAYVAANTTAGNPELSLNIMSAFRLPSSLEPAIATDAVVGDITPSAGGGISAVTVALDDACNDVLTNLDKKVVVKGALIVAYIPFGAVISDELSTELDIVVCNGQRLVVGRSNQDALDGIYTPFSAAWAYAVITTATMAPTVAVRESQTISRGLSSK